MSNFIISTIFGGWFLLSFLAQSKSKYINRWKSKDLFKLIPNWRFFAPVPVRTDYHLEYRLLSRDHKKSPWEKAVPLQPRKNWCFLWYPEKRYRKALNTAINQLKRISQTSGYRPAANSYAYLGILYFLQELNHPTDAHALQFRVISKQDFAENSIFNLIFRSRWHSQF